MRKKEIINVLNAELEQQRKQITNYLKAIDFFQNEVFKQQKVIAILEKENKRANDFSRDVIGETLRIRKYEYSTLEPEYTYFNRKTREFVVCWKDGKVTKVNVHPDDEVNFNIGFSLCLTKKIMGANWRDEASKSYRPTKVGGK